MIKTADASTRRLFFWGARGLYIGPAFGLRPHRNAVAVLCVALDSQASLDCDPLRKDSAQISFRTALIPPSTLHHLYVAPGARMAFLYVDTLSDDYRCLQKSMRCTGQRFTFNHANEPALIDTLLALSAGASWRDMRDELAVQLALPPARSGDLRIADALARLQLSPLHSHSLSEVAQHAHLSPSHFLHLFKAETGVPFRRYKLWIRIGAALKAMRTGATLTEAAHCSGFSSSSHFSSAFSGMFGMPPSRISQFF